MLAALMCEEPQGKDTHTALATALGMTAETAKHVETAARAVMLEFGQAVGALFGGRRADAASWLRSLQADGRFDCLL
jgi:hypothetical protein